jgi:selenocysteine lyase/cysteine desulfurase
MLDCQRQHFAIPEGSHYLNCAYMGPLSRRVQQAGVEGIRRKADPSGIHAHHFFDETDEVRRLFARLLGVRDRTRVAILPAVSYGIATIARNTKPARGQNVVVAGEQFPSNVYAWRSLCRRSDATLRTVDPPSSERRGESWNAALLDAIDAGTALVALPHVHWTDGTRFDLASIGERARQHGAALVVDASQSLGALPFDLETIRPDAVVCAGYKWLLAPYSISLGWFGERYDGGEPLEETWIARDASEDFQRLVHYRDEYQPGALRYDVGERSNFILMPMLKTALEEIHAWRPDRIQAYCAKLSEPAIAEAVSIGFRVEQSAWRAAHLFGLRTPPGLDLADLQAALQRARVSASLRGTALRVSPNVYNDESDTAALLGVLRSAATRVVA